MGCHLTVAIFSTGQNAYRYGPNEHVGIKKSTFADYNLKTFMMIEVKP
jgi:hypothetical protein